MMVYIILVNWNGWKDTVECLESLLRLDDQDFRVIICDNNSHDSSIERICDWAHSPTPQRYESLVWLKSGLHPRRREPSVRVISQSDILKPGDDAVVTIIALEDNVGFAAANNIGMRLARGDAATEFIWLLNNDTVVSPGALGPLTERMKCDPSLGFLGSCLLYYDRPEIVQTLGGWYDLWKANGGPIGEGLHYNKLPNVEDVERQLAHVAGASIFLPLHVLEEIGEMYESYFLYYEELDWAVRLKGRYQQSVCLESVIYHKQGASIGKNLLKRPGNISLYYVGVNRLRFTGRHKPLFVPIALGRLTFGFFVHLIRWDVQAMLIKLMIFADFCSGHQRSRSDLPLVEMTTRT